jgi:serine/threonine-protein kinase
VLLRGDVGTFRLMYQIKEGGLGSLFRAFDRRTSTTAVVKILEVPQNLAEWEVQAFQKTLAALRTLDHPHCAAVLAADVCDSYAYIVREELPHVPWDPAFAPDGVLTLDAALDFILQAAHGLQAAARVGVRHGHLHPEKLRLDANQKVRVTGFGEAVFANHILVATGMEPRHLAYLPPEALRGIEEDERSDIYGLGAILFHLLSGETPGEGETDLVKLRALIEAGLPRIETVVPTLPPAVTGVINRMVHPDASLRFQQWTDVVARLETALSALRRNLLTPAEPTPAPPPQPTPIPPPVSRPKVSTPRIVSAATPTLTPAPSPAQRPIPAVRPTVRPARDGDTAALAHLPKATPLRRPPPTERLSE